MSSNLPYLWTSKPKGKLISGLLVTKVREGEWEDMAGPGTGLLLWVLLAAVLFSSHSLPEEPIIEET